MPVIGEIGFESISILGTERSRTLTEELAVKCGLLYCYFDYDEALLSDANTGTARISRERRYGMYRIVSKKELRPTVTLYEAEASHCDRNFNSRSESSENGEAESDRDRFLFAIIQNHSRARAQNHSRHQQVNQNKRAGHVVHAGTLFIHRIVAATDNRNMMFLDACRIACAIVGALSQ